MEIRLENIRCISVFIMGALIALLTYPKTHQTYGFPLSILLGSVAMSLQVSTCPVGHQPLTLHRFPLCSTTHCNFLCFSCTGLFHSPELTGSRATAFQQCSHFWWNDSLSLHLVNSRLSFYSQFEFHFSFYDNPDKFKSLCISSSYQS